VRRLGRRTELVELRAKVGELRTAERLLERELAEVKAELRARCAAMEAVIEAQQRHLADLRGERDRLLEMVAAERVRVDRLLAERSRRRWRWWRRGG
jgi:predicted nuclease with TOPRIM domain